MNNSETFVFTKLPQNVEELMALPEADLLSPYKTAALSMVALLMFEKDAEASFSMLDALRGPEPLTPYGKSFIKERLMGKEYKVKSFFQGATVERGIKLRKKPSTGQWFLNEIMCLSDIRVPASADPWA